MNLALIGRNVSASQSPRIHKFIFALFQEECVFELISLGERRLEKQTAEELFSRFDGMNVTMPYKRELVPYLAKLTGAAEKIRAVNTVLCKSREGYNFDCDGLSLLLKENHIGGESALVLGAGGAGRCAAYVLLKAGMKVAVYGKYEEQLAGIKEDLEGVTPLARLKEGAYDLVLNCTGIGMGGTEGALPLVQTREGEKFFSSEMFRALKIRQAVDLIYAPKQSAFLLEAGRAGAKTVNGEGMLFYQGYYADCLYLSKVPHEQEAKEFYKKYKEEF